MVAKGCRLVTSPSRPLPQMNEEEAREQRGGGTNNRCNRTATVRGNVHT